MKKIISEFPPEPTTPIKAGFPNPAKDARSTALDLNELVVRHPVSTFYLKVEGSVMQSVGIADGDIVVVDRSLEPKSGGIVVVALDGEFTVRQLKREGRQLWLVVNNSSEGPISLEEIADVILWGVVTYVIHKIRR